MNSLTRIRVFSRSRSSAARPACDARGYDGSSLRRPLRPARTLHALQGLQDVRLHRILIHRRALALLPLLPAAALLGVGAEGAGRRRRAPGRRRATRPGGRGGRAAAEHRLGAAARSAAARTLDARRDERRARSRSAARTARGGQRRGLRRAAARGSSLGGRRSRPRARAGAGGRSLNSARARSSSDWVGAGSSSSTTRALELERGQLGRLLGLRPGPRPAPPRRRCGGAWSACASTGARRQARRLRPPCGGPSWRAGSSACLRFSRSQRTRTADTWSFSRADMWLRTKMFMSLSMLRSCSGATPNSAARSCTLVLTTQSSISCVRAPAAPCRRPTRGPAHLPPSPAAFPTCAPIAAARGPAQERHSLRRGQPDHLVHGARAGVLRHDHAPALPCLQILPHRVHPDRHRAGRGTPGRAGPGARSSAGRGPPRRLPRR